MQKLLPQIYLIQAIRDFFKQEGFLDVLTPPMVENPGMETHLHPFQLASAKNKKLLPQYLHTSPEFHMKELLSLGMGDIFTICYCFRDENHSPIHRPQFLMLEWYRHNQRYEKIMDDCEELILFCQKQLLYKNLPVRNFQQKHFIRMTVQELFQETLHFDILEYLDKESLCELIEERFPHIPLPNDLSCITWDDAYFLLFLNEIEPTLEKYPYLLIYDFPYHLSALSTIKDTDPRVCERFEIYLHGIELCNCFNELRDLRSLKKRFEEQAIQKQKLYQYQLPEPSILFQAMTRGLPPSSGIALGVERLLLGLTGKEDIFWK